VPSQGNLLDWADKALGQGISSVTRSVKNLLSGARQAPVAAALEALMDGKQVRAAGVQAYAVAGVHRNLLRCQYQTHAACLGRQSSNPISLTVPIWLTVPACLLLLQGTQEFDSFAVMDPKLPPGRTGGGQTSHLSIQAACQPTSQPCMQLDLVTAVMNRPAVRGVLHRLACCWLSWWPAACMCQQF
jgi:hypothetical protein